MTADEAGGPSTEPFRTARSALVEQSRKQWSEQLIDRSRRNNLLYFRDLASGTLELSGENPELICRLLGTEDAIDVKLLVPLAEEKRLVAVLREIDRRALANLEEKGLDTLFVAVGLATWQVADEGRPPASPVLLIPVKLEWRGREARSSAIRRVGDTQLNLVLLHALQVEHGVSLSADARPFDPTQDEEQDETEVEAAARAVAEVYRWLIDETSRVPGFAVTPRIILGNFSFQKMAMVRDLQELGPQLAEHGIVAALAGDPEAQALLRLTDPPFDRRNLDRVSPEHEFLIRDADSSQQAVVARVERGEHLVIQGPPGTGKSQTIANLISTLVARGKRVLFVAEKRAALEVVLERLRQAGLGHLALDLHGADISRRRLMERLRETWNLARASEEVGAGELHRRLEEDRDRLNEHARRLHHPHPGCGLSPYQMQGLLLRTPPPLRARTRWRGTALRGLDALMARRVEGVLQDLESYAALLQGTDPSPWTPAEIRDASAAQAVGDAVPRLRSALPAIQFAAGALADAVGLPAPPGLSVARLLLTAARLAARTTTVYRGTLFDEDLSSLEKMLAPASGGMLRQLWGWCTTADYRNALRAVRSHRRDARVPSAMLLLEVRQAIEAAQAWRAVDGTARIAPEPVDSEALAAALASANDASVLLTQAFGAVAVEAGGWDGLDGWLGELDADRQAPARIGRLHEYLAELRSLGMAEFLDELAGGSLGDAGWDDAFRHAWLASWLDHARLTDPYLAGFSGKTHSRVAEDFRMRDCDRIRIAASRVRRAHAEAMTMAMNQHPDQEVLVRRELEKRSRHLSLRELVRRAPEVLTALAPCWMASPLSVSQLIPGDRPLFDVVIFDEASQVLPHDAVPTLVRARQAVVAGDDHQLPPTTFFADGADEETSEDGTDPAEDVRGFESLLQLMRTVVPQPTSLEWHYRSRDESLIAFSNRHIYAREGHPMVTFPGPSSMDSLSHVLVHPRVLRDGQEESGVDEVEQVVALVLAHAEDRPHETLGVIAMGIKHAQRVQAALDRALEQRRDLDDFFSESRPERFFVKNLERVQGDERDAIILTVGYGKDRSGRLPYRFGPLNQAGGERRLNVAITRARRRMTLVSSFGHHDMDPGRSRSRGVELLRLYLEFAASRGCNLGDARAEAPPLNPFEEDVREGLTLRGMALEPQWGASRCRIDFVVKHPDQPGRFVLAIECDGAAYHSSPTARDRDRLRQQHLEALGWRFCRVWSTDWFTDRAQEIERVWRVYQVALASVAQDEATAAVPAQPAPVPSPEIHRERVRAPRPDVPHRTSITEYRSHELQALLEWLLSDGRLRTDEELIDELRVELGFARRGARIESACRQAIAALRSRPARN